MAFTYKSVSGFLTKEECEEILNFSLKNLIFSPAETATKDKRGVDTNFRKSNIVFYPYYKKFPFLLEKITKLLYNNINVKGFKLDYKNSEFQFTEYNTGDFFDWHNDMYVNKSAESNRYCSIVIQLNDDYENGNLEIKPADSEIIIIEKGIGNLTMFLSDMEHRVSTITNGNRYTLVNWIKLEKENNYKKTII